MRKIIMNILCSILMILGVSVALLVCIPTSAEAGIKFQIIRTVSGCKYFVAEQGFDYILVDKWTCYASKGSSGFGKLDGYGMKEVVIDGVECTLYVDNYMLSQSRAFEKLLEKCE